jgi:uncharacterized membrane protein
MLTDTINAALLEELRFAKRQQWTITAAVVALIAGTYSVTRELDDPWEKVGATILVVVAIGGGIYWLCDLQGQLYRTRLAIDRYDPDPWWRGADVASGMVGALILSGAAVAICCCVTGPTNCCLICYCCLP